MKIQALRTAVTGSIGAVSAALGIGCTVGVCFCSIPVIVFMLSLLGLSTVFIYQNSLFFTAIGIIFMSISVFSLLRIISRRKMCNLKGLIK